MITLKNIPFRALFTAPKCRETHVFVTLLFPWPLRLTGGRNQLFLLWGGWGGVPRIGFPEEKLIHRLE